MAIIGGLSKSAGSFKIDHPLDPANKYLYHSFVESPDMMNIYNGNVTTDANGYAAITLPDWFMTLNKDLRYQLTVIGVFAQAIVDEEIAENHFRIRTNQPNVKVSWQVTGIRHDAYAVAHPSVVEEDKPANEKGTFTFPELYGQTLKNQCRASCIRKGQSLASNTFHPGRGTLNQRTGDRNCNFPGGQSSDYHHLRRLLHS